MKKIRTTHKKLLSLLLVIIILVSIAPADLFSVMATGYAPRKDAPSYSGYYAPRSSYNPFTVNYNAYGGNCTWYAWGRAYELLGSRPKLSTGNAGEWYGYNKSNGLYSYGTTPKLGAVACWSGHVAVVEEIYSNGSFLISESGWTTCYFRTVTIPSNGTYNGAGTFQGFIYVGSDKYANLGEDFYAYMSNADTGKWIANINNNVNGENANANNNQTWRFKRCSDGSYSILSYENGYAMDVAGALDTAGTNLQLMPYVDNAAQRFYIYEENGYYTFKCAYADIWFEMNSSNYNVSLGNKSSANTQKFVIQKCDYNGNLPQNLGEDFYAYMSNADTGKWIANINNNVNGESANANNNQTWRFKRFSDGSYSILSYENGYAMDVADFLDTAGTNLQLVPYVNNAAQRFYIYEENGYYTFKCSYADIWFEMNSSNYNISLENKSSANTQKFVIQKCDPEEITSSFEIKGTLKTFGNSDDEIFVDFYKPGESDSCGYTIFNGSAEEFCLGGIKAGEYIIKISKPNHVTREYSVVVDKDIELDIELNLIGDINGDGKVTVLDYNQVLKHVKKTGNLDDYERACADVDGNGKVMVSDYARILRHVKKTDLLW